MHKLIQPLLDFWNELVAIGVVAYWLAFVLIVLGTLWFTALNSWAPDWLEAISTFVSMLIAGTAAIQALTIWRRQSLSNRKAEVAEHVLEVANMAAVALRTARATSVRALGTDREASASGYAQRLEYLQRAGESFAAVETAKLKAEVFLGVGLMEPMKVFGDIRNELLTNLQILVGAAAEPFDPYAAPLLASSRAVAVGQNADELDRRISDALEAVRAVCLPHIQLLARGS